MVYIKLKKGQRLIPGDEVKTYNGEWIPTSCVGEKVGWNYKTMSEYRRPVTSKQKSNKIATEQEITEALNWMCSIEKKTIKEDIEQWKFVMDILLRRKKIVD